MDRDARDVDDLGDTLLDGTVSGQSSSRAVEHGTQERTFVSSENWTIMQESEWQQGNRRGNEESWLLELADQKFSERRLKFRLSLQLATLHLQTLLSPSFSLLRFNSPLLY